MAQKKITRKQLLKEPDEFISYSGKIIEWATGHRNHILIIIGVVVTGLIVFSAVRYFNEKTENTAFTLLNDALANYESDLQNQSSEIAYQKAEKNFNHIFDKYSGKSANKIARLEFAKISLSSGKYDQAIELYTQSIKDFKNPSAYRNFALSGIAHAYLEKKDAPAALKYFEMVAQSGMDVLQEEALFHLGLLNRQMGNVEKSEEAFRQLLEKYPGSVYEEVSQTYLNG
jgi:tetratricopeptide (TPR) repeat protein